MVKIDKVACLKHIAAENGISLSHWSKTEEARRETSLKQKKKSISDKTAEYGHQIIHVVFNQP